MCFKRLVITEYEHNITKVFLSFLFTVSTNEPPILLQSSKIIVKPEDTKVGKFLFHDFHRNKEKTELTPGSEISSGF